VICAEAAKSKESKLPPNVTPNVCLGASLSSSSRNQHQYAFQTGYERDTLSYRGTSFVVMEVGGGMKGNWSSYYSKCSVIIVCVVCSFAVLRAVCPALTLRLLFPLQLQYVLDRANRRQLSTVAFDLYCIRTPPLLFFGC
jgi:hypothetical protein